MIGTHNSFSYLKPVHWIFNLFTWLWRCQRKTYVEQRNLGVEYFDIRLGKYKGSWCFQHGLVKFRSLINIWDLLEDLDRDSCFCRIILEDSKYTSEFLDFLQEAAKKFQCIKFACIKSGWKIIVDNDFKIHDFTYTPILSGKNLFWSNIWRFLSNITTIEKNADKNNPEITYEIAQSPEVYFMDFI